ncbi:Cation channel sperm-associated protein subunit beta [Galemys pyrenaicus]|uniref:Cation channel sperm-associated protein subunit beta n=1 Tax=Galemys pyrenaicus TaxID=202257 RepID=A0A8J6DQ23_GALPY|nr:Cation channel sperm-associated protein subunit beta [Galemys pyrenaicus]
MGVAQKNEIIKLYLSTENLVVICDFQSETTITSREFLSMFTSGGLSPSLEIINSTYTGIFYFNLTLFSDRDYWLIDIPRENITRNTEPVLQCILGATISEHDIKKLQPHVADIKVAKCPCANDVALLGFIMNSTHNGIYIGLSDGGFWNYGDTIWHDLSDTMYAEVEEEHKDLSVVDMVLTNHYLVILTSLGLFVSEDLRYTALLLLRFSRADFCGFERVDYVKGKLWYNEKCFANREHFEVDYVTITFERNRTLSEANSCFYSNEPFHTWLPCLPKISKRKQMFPSTVITFLIDQELKTGVYLFYNSFQRSARVSVNILQNNKPILKQKFPSFYFPRSFKSPTGMVFHPRSHFLYVYGNQVWLSVDGGNTFELLADFHNDIIINTFHSFYTSDITFVSKSGKVYLTKAGMKRYSELGTISDKIFTLYYDHMGFLHKLTPDHFEAGGPLTAFGNTKGIFAQPADMGFETALAPQFISSNEMIFYAYVPVNESKDSIHTKKFNHIHLGKVIHSGKTGRAYVKEILQYDTPEGFLSSAITEIADPFGLEEAHESSCLLSSLLIEDAGPPGVTSSFVDSDIEKTVVIPGYSSFLITNISDAKHALAIATMPEIVPHNRTFPKNSWFLYNFGQRSGRTWKIYSKPCNYWFQQPDTTLALNVLKYIDLGKSRTLKVKIIPSSKDTRILEIPLLKVIIGNPNLLAFKAEGSFDDTDSYIMEISAASKDLHQGSTSLALVVWGASTECFVTTFVPIWKSSCSYIKHMHYLPMKIIPEKDWTSGVHKDSQGFNLIKTLPVNYRPPSNMGIAIPLTDNFYHADPSKPIPRNLFHKSKRLPPRKKKQVNLYEFNLQRSGKYKQCANKSNRKACNCTNDQKLSYAVAFSDCREKVPRFKFPVTNYPIYLEVHENERFPLPTSYLVTVTEVNGRGNWKLKHSVPENVKNLKVYLEQKLNAPVYNPLGLNLSIKGSELFHFRVSVIPGVTFCNLVDEFQIYVDEVPLPFPGHTLIAVASAVVLGGLIFISFVLQIRNIHPWDWCRNLVRKTMTLPLNSTNQVARS